ncbi:hypothetical protein FGO68_gene16023 [Halteria grandinella]|uniref:Uncharacterized protein n=1 Tax=Halteria grandinella TaxID=5974 RepID=A0A8J8N974_HALGN|nr:hypothetical protein FGO68_gene16023 [Halteria grandinella]
MSTRGRGVSWCEGVFISQLDNHTYINHLITCAAMKSVSGCLQAQRPLAQSAHPLIAGFPLQPPDDPNWAHTLSVAHMQEGDRIMKVNDMRICTADSPFPCFARVSRSTCGDRDGLYSHGKSGGGSLSETSNGDDGRKGIQTQNHSDPHPYRSPGLVIFPYSDGGHSGNSALCFSLGGAFSCRSLKRRMSCYGATCRNLCMLIFNHESDLRNALSCNSSSSLVLEHSYSFLMQMIANQQMFVMDHQRTYLSQVPFEEGAWRGLLMSPRIQAF